MFALGSSPSHPVASLRAQCVTSDPRSEVNTITATPRLHPKLDLRLRVAGRFLRLFNPLARRLISAGIPTGAPNVLLTVRGRRSGKLRMVPVAMLDLDGAWFVQACFGETGWVANLRAAGEANVTHPGGRRVPVRAIELTPEEAGPVLQRALEPFRRSRVFGALYGPRARGPVGIMWAFGIRMDETLEEYTAAARLYPLFELRPMTDAPPSPDTPAGLSVNSSPPRRWRGR
jgi:deazaflavin-dependent oxidoreductase (nitroreductase family)